MRTFSFLLLFGGFALLTGCAESETATEETPQTSAPADGDAEDHSDHDHDGDHAAHGEEAKPVAMNANCPIMGSPVKADGGSAPYNGKTVGFCCPGCVEKWTSLSDEDKAKKLAEANPAGDEKPDA